MKLSITTAQFICRSQSCITKLSTNLGNCQGRKENDCESKHHQAKVGDLDPCSRVSLTDFICSPEKADFAQIPFNKKMGIIVLLKSGVFSRLLSTQILQWWEMSQIKPLMESSLHYEKKNNPNRTHLFLSQKKSATLTPPVTGNWR